MNATSEADERLLATDLHVEATSRLVEALVESENRMRRRVDLLADAVVETDANGNLVFLNPAWTTLTGWSSPECLNRSMSSYFPVECRAEVECVLADRTGTHQELATRLHRSDGRTVRVVLTTSPIPSAGVVAVLRDVTREYAYQEELRKLSAVASSTGNLVVITDAHGFIDWVNPAFEDRTGYALDEVIGLRPGAFLQGPDTDLAAVDRLRTAIREERPANEELLNYSKSGEPYWINVNLTPVVDSAGRLERFISVQSDTTERRRVERMKKEFVSTVSHELRTPLTAISGAVGLLVGGAAGPLPEQSTALLDIAHKNSVRLTALINDLLDMDRLVDGGIPLDSHVQGVMPIIKRAIHDNLTYAAQYDVTIQLTEQQDDALVDVDSLRLGQVMSNLLSNSCKFAPAHTAVDVGVSPGPAGGVRITVSDCGPGVPDAFRSVIFQKFSQADASDTRSRGGTGLGLAISKELVERMGGTIGFTSAEGAGSTFFVDLPLAVDADAGIPR